MAQIIGTDMEWYYSDPSGAGTNSNANSSLGGVRSSAIFVDNTISALFDVVSGSESAAGDTNYRCLYVKNNHSTAIAYNARVWLIENTKTNDNDSAATSTDEISIGVEAVGATAVTIANEATAPAGVTFTVANADSEGVGTVVTIGNVAPGQSVPVWFKRTVPAGEGAKPVVDFAWKVRIESE